MKFLERLIPRRQFVKLAQLGRGNTRNWKETWNGLDWAPNGG